MDYYYSAYLREHDNPAHWMEPPDFHYGEAQRRFLRFVGELSIKLGIPLKTETGELLQDAIYHGEVLLPAEEGGRPCMRFSCFGNMVTIMEPERVPESVVTIIRELVKTHGYVYIPCSVLLQPYTGQSPGSDRFADWFSRYFGA